MNPKHILCLAVILSGAFSGCSTGRSNTAPQAGFGPGLALNRQISFRGEYLLVRNRLWDVKTGREVRRFAVPPQITMSNGMQYGSAIVAVATFSPDGKQVLTGNNLSWGVILNGGPIQLWDVATGRELLRFETGGFVNDVQFSPDGSRILTASDAGTNSVQIWDAKTGRRLLELQGLWANGFVPVAYNVNFSLEGRKLAILSFRQVTISDSVTGRQICALKRSTKPEGFFVSTQFSPDGKEILTSDLLLLGKSGKE